MSTSRPVRRSPLASPPPCLPYLHPRRRPASVPAAFATAGESGGGDALPAAAVVSPATVMTPVVSLFSHIAPPKLAARQPPTQLPTQTRRRVREREEKGRGWERVMTWPADMWGPRRELRASGDEATSCGAAPSPYSPSTSVAR
uniref:Uncharacterized protein n=1 Tax=Oryza nivara TaxID=4536 RepID=A0A0E0GU29_ORYNI